MRTAAVAALATAVLTGCGDDDGPPPTATVTVPATTPTAPAPVTIGAVVWGSAVDPDTGAPVDRLTALPDTAPRVVAAVGAETLPAGTVLQARWTIDGEPLAALEPAPVTVDAARADAWVTWTLTWGDEQPWPIGRLGIVVEVNGEVRASDEIPIVRARE